MLEKLAVFYKREVEATVSALNQSNGASSDFCCSRNRGNNRHLSLSSDVQLDHKHGELIFSANRSSPSSCKHIS